MGVWDTVDLGSVDSESVNYGISDLGSLFHEPVYLGRIILESRGFQLMKFELIFFSFGGF